MQVVAPFEPALVAIDMAAMLAFYRGVLGMRLFSVDTIPADAARRAGLSEGGYTIARLETDGGDRLKILVPERTAATAPQKGRVLDRQGYAYLTFIVPDVRAVLAAVLAAGGRVRTGPEPIAFRPGIVDLAFVEDPEGNCLEFVQRSDLAAYRPPRPGSP